VVFKTYTGEKLKPIGVLTVNVEYNKSRYVLDLYVVNRGGPPLLGREWLKHIKLDWHNINCLSSANILAGEVLQKIQDLQARYSNIFQPGLGKLANIKAKLNVKENCQPKFAKARQVPHALRPKVEAELDELEKAGILTKVDHSEWTTAIVPVVKRNNTVRICGDFKTTLNPALNIDQYPLPSIDDIFASLAGGQKFSKIDLRSAYLQCEIDDESKQYLTINTHKGLYRYNRLVAGVALAAAFAA